MWVESEKASWLSVLNWTLPMEVFVVSAADLLNEITLIFSLFANQVLLYITPIQY